MSLQKKKIKCQLIHSCLKTLINDPAHTHKYNKSTTVQCIQLARAYNLQTKITDSRINPDWV